MLHYPDSAYLKVLANIIHTAAGHTFVNVEHAAATLVRKRLKNGVH